MGTTLIQPRDWDPDLETIARSLTDKERSELIKIIEDMKVDGEEKGSLEKGPVKLLDEILTGTELVEGLKNRYSDEWVVVEVLENDEEGTITKCRLLYHSEKRDIALMVNRMVDEYTYTFFAGDIPKKGHMFAY